MKRWFFLFSLLASLVSYSVAGSININKADADEIAQALKGIGKVKAEAIVEYREEYGDFASVEELLNVPGIGEKTLNDNREKITLSEEE